MPNTTITSPTEQQTPKHWSISTSNSSLGTDANISANPKRDMAYRVWRTRVGTALLDYGGLDKEAFNFNGCSLHPISRIKTNTPTLPADAATAWICSHNLEHDAALFMPTCDLRICPDCAARQTARLAARYIPKAIDLTKENPQYHLRHIVFTTPIELTSDTPEKIQKQIVRYARLPKVALDIVQEVGNLHGRDWTTLGGIQSAEFGTDGLKLHFHVVQFGAYVDQSELVKAWKQVTNNEASIVFIRKIDASSPEAIQNDVIETLKYSVKFWATDETTGETKYLDPTVMPHLLRTLKGIRRVKSWGCFYNLPDIKKEPFCCETCSHEMERVGVENWHLVIKAVTDGKTYKQVKFEQSFLNLKLANKSKKATLYQSKSPPDSDEKYRQKDMWKPVSHSHYHYEDNL